MYSVKVNTTSHSWEFERGIRSSVIRSDGCLVLIREDGEEIVFNSSYWTNYFIWDTVEETNG